MEMKIWISEKKKEKKRQFDRFYLSSALDDNLEIEG